MGSIPITCSIYSRISEFFYSCPISTLFNLFINEKQLKMSLKEDIVSVIKDSFNECKDTSYKDTLLTIK